ncbi:MAG: hypothetical protein ACYDCL_09435 [Myxococcales bacterium]
MGRTSLFCSVLALAACSGGPPPGCDAACPAGCLLSADCTRCTPSGPEAGLGSSCRNDLDCCTGICGRGHLCVASGGSTGSTGGGDDGAEGASGGSGGGSSGGTTGLGGAGDPESWTISGSGGSSGGGAWICGETGKASCTGPTGPRDCCSQYCVDERCHCNVGGDVYPCVTDADCCADSSKGCGEDGNCR